MKRFVLFAALALGVGLAGCSTIQSVVGNSPAAEDALKATNGTLLAYHDVAQAGLLTFGNLPTCPQPSGTVCKDSGTWQKLKATDAATVALINGAKAVLDGSQDDAGQIAAALAAIQQAQAQFSQAGVTLAPSQ